MSAPGAELKGVESTRMESHRGNSGHSPAVVAVAAAKEAGRRAAATVISFRE